MAVGRSFFSVELCFSFSAAAPVHRQVQRILSRTLDDVPVREKWANHRAIADILLAHVNTAVRGCWEYMDDDGDDRMWNDWLLPMKDRTRQPMGQYDGGYFTVTLMMQCKRGSPTDRTAQTAFRAAGSDLWTRDTFATMLQAIPGISFAGVVKDALYLMPRDNNVGFTDDELRLPRMTYLRVLV